MPLPDRPEAVVRKSARQSIYEQLRDWIVYGPLEPSESIRDKQLAELLGVSRTPVREALLKLAEEGLVDITPGSGTRVAPLDLSRAEHYFTIGGTLDSLAAELATPLLSNDDISDLQTIVDQMAGGPEPRTFQQFDEDFHRIYYHRSANPPLAEMLENITIYLRRYDRAGFHHVESIPDVLNEHQALVDAFRSRSPDRAARAARDNWRNAWQRLRTHFFRENKREPAPTGAEQR